ncbi:MAG: phosphoglycolate phosphatase [Proteobacteria bacterium]|nr:phosphoglycolate phosphatase [Pseudomonadota bacterium]
MKPQAISFDLDGTLVDTAAEIAEAANRTLAEFGLQRRPLPEIQVLIGRGSHALMRAVLARAQSESEPALVPGEARMLERFDTHYADTIGEFSAPYPGAHEALELLKARGMRLACVTNKEFRHAQRLLLRHGLHRHFEMVVGGDSLPWQKPHGRVLRVVADAMGVACADLMHVGDSAIDVEAGRNAGVRVWALPHGYNAGRPIAEACPDAILPDLMSVAHAALDASPSLHPPTPPPPL